MWPRRPGRPSRFAAPAARRGLRAVARRAVRRGPGRPLRPAPADDRLRACPGARRSPSSRWPALAVAAARAGRRPGRRRAGLPAGVAGGGPSLVPAAGARRRQRPARVWSPTSRSWPGPLLAAALLPWLGTRGVLAVDAASFLVSAALLTRLPRLAPAALEVESLWKRRPHRPGYLAPAPHGPDASRSASVRSSCAPASTTWPWSCWPRRTCARATRSRRSCSARSASASPPATRCCRSSATGSG